MTSVGRVLGLVIAVGITGGCATTGPGGTSAAPSDRLLRAAEAMNREDFATARAELAELVTRCELGDQRHEALLLLAAAELDPANIDGSPREAAGLAANYLLTADAQARWMPLARTLYRVAADVGRLTPYDLMPGVLGEGHALVPCAPTGSDSAGVLPDLATPTSEHIRSLESALSARSDSMQVLSTRVESLEAELERVAALLRSGVGGSR
jgi:hypothetical protein